MRPPIEINLNYPQPQIDAGIIGEHNIQELVITPPAHLMDVDHYRVAFKVGDAPHHTEPLTGDTLTVALWQELTSASSASMTLVGYAADNSYIGKSDMVFLTFGAAVDVDGEPGEANTEPHGMAIDVEANTLARHTHTNKVTLNKFTEDANGGILFGGEPIKTSPIIVDTETELNELYPTPADGLDAIVREYEKISDNPYTNQLTAEKLYINDDFNLTEFSHLLFYGTVGEYTGKFSIVASTDASLILPSLIGIEIMIIVPEDDDSEAPLYFRFNEETFIEELGLTFSKGWNKVSEDEVTPIEFSDIPVPEDCTIIHSAEVKDLISLSEWYSQSKPFYSLDGKWNEYKASKIPLYIKGRDNRALHITDTVNIINSMYLESGVYTSPTSMDMVKFWSWSVYPSDDLYYIPPSTPLTIEGLTAAYRLLFISLFPEGMSDFISVTLSHDSQTAFSGVVGDTNYFYVTYMHIVTGEQWTETGTREIMIVLEEE